MDDPNANNPAAPTQTPPPADGGMTTPPAAPTGMPEPTPTEPTPTPGEMPPAAPAEPTETHEDPGAGGMGGGMPPAAA